jgi:hypothetical protein
VETECAPNLPSHRFGELYSILVYRPTLASPDVAAVNGCICPRSGRLELIDDCEGALTISPLLGLDVGTEDWLAQMEVDFLAGLNDHDSAARLSSNQRLGGLKLPSSRDALHGVIENGNAGESKWAVYAALRTGDVSVLPRVRQLLATRDRDHWYSSRSEGTCFGPPRSDLPPVVIVGETNCRHERF